MEKINIQPDTRWKRFWRCFLKPKCPYCKDGRLSQTKIDFINNKMVEIYTCDCCDGEFI